jgi:hypothetical protein
MGGCLHPVSSRRSVERRRVGSVGRVNFGRFAHFSADGNPDF